MRTFIEHRLCGDRSGRQTRPQIKLTVPSTETVAMCWSLGTRTRNTATRAATVRGDERHDRIFRSG
jgi:hypothetical protein